MLCDVSSSDLFFFKQKTAYEMRISDWSSDVCSSDLRRWSKECRDADRRAHLWRRAQLRRPMELRRLTRPSRPRYAACCGSRTRIRPVESIVITRSSCWLRTVSYDSNRPIPGGLAERRWPSPSTPHRSAIGEAHV